LQETSDGGLHLYTDVLGGYTDVLSAIPHSQANRLILMIDHSGFGWDPNCTA